MPGLHKDSAEKTYRAIGRFIFEFSQADYTIRHYLAQEINLDEDHFDAIISSFDVALLCTVTKEVFNKSRANSNATAIIELINKFHELNAFRVRVAHGLWAPSKDGGTVFNVPRSTPKLRTAANQADALEKHADTASNLRAELERAFVPPKPKI